MTLRCGWNAFLDSLVDWRKVESIVRSSKGCAVGSLVRTVSLVMYLFGKQAISTEEWVQHLLGALNSVVVDMEGEDLLHSMGLKSDVAAGYVHHVAASCALLLPQVMNSSQARTLLVEERWGERLLGVLSSVSARVGKNARQVDSNMWDRYGVALMYLTLGQMASGSSAWPFFVTPPPIPRTSPCVI